MYRCFALVIAVALATSCGTPVPAHQSDKPDKSETSPDRRVVNLRAFAKLYGYVKYFHPSDQASEIDWTRFARYGVSRVKYADDRAQLKAALIELFAPIAPTVQILGPGETAAELPALSPPSTAGMTPVAWQHLGLGLDAAGSQAYKSVRVGRVRAGLDAAGAIEQSIPARALRGKRVRLTGWIRTEITGEAGQADLYLRAYKAYYRRGMSVDHMKQPIRAPAWTAYQVEGEVDDDAEQLEVGVRLVGQGVIYADNLSLEVADGKTWKPHKLTDPGLDVDVEASTWVYSGDYYDITTATQGAREGEAMARIATKDLSRYTLFDGHPKVGEVTEAVLGDDLRGVVPLALWSKDGHMLGAPQSPLKPLTERLASLPDDHTADHEDVRLAGVVIAWNAMQHFHPYFDVVKPDWDGALDRALTSALRDVGAHRFYDALRAMSALLDDGHANVLHSKIGRFTGALQFDMEPFEGVPVVTRSWHDQVRVGDVITAWNGAPIKDVLDKRIGLLSGSPHRARLLAIWKLRGGYDGDPIEFEVEGADGRRKVAMAFKSHTPPDPGLPAPVRALDDGIYLVDLTRATADEFRSQVDAIAKARGVIFDLRGYPRTGKEFLSHLMSGPDNVKWMFIPQITYPDRNNWQWQAHGWGVKPKQPHIAGKVVFMTDERAISFSESIMGYVVGYRLGDIVGAPTAGANGNYNAVTLPGGFRFSFTGMRVLQHDGAPFYGRGLQPTVPVTPTIAGLRAGRDEVFDKALELVRRR